ncbi:MAG: putative ABC transporter permease [bacterium]|nr:putative ABC transporter permease [bacterium]MCM1500225.1 putative ABC transporter permease [Clostridium sp.]
MLWGYDFYKLFLIFLFWGVIGWMIEVIDMRIEAGEFQNRGFLHMPFCPIYGIGMAIASVGLNGVKNSCLILFLFGVIFCSVFEYVVGGILEKLFHTKWWDYSHMRFNIKGRVCLRNAVLFGIGAILVFRFVEPTVEKAIAGIPINFGIAIAVIFGVAFAVDMITSAKRAWSYRKKQEDGELLLLFKAHR